MTRFRGTLTAALLFFLATVPSYAQSTALPDRFVPLANGGTRIEKDTNGDGMVDCIIIVDSEGRNVEEELDTNSDGKMDSFYYFTKGVLTRVEIDSNYDGKIDIWVWLKDGLYVTRYERDTDFDGKIDVVKDFEHSGKDEPALGSTNPPSPDTPGAAAAGGGS